MNATDGADERGPVDPGPTNAFQQPVQEAAAQEPPANAVRPTETGHGTDRRRQRRAVRLMCAAGVLFGAGVIGLALPVRMDAGKISAGLPLPTSVPPSPTTAAPPSSFVAFTTSPTSAPVTTITVALPVPSPTTAAQTVAGLAARTAAANRAAAANRNATALPLSAEPALTTPPVASAPTDATTTSTTTTVAPGPPIPPPTLIPPPPPTPAPPPPPPPPAVDFTVHWRSPNCDAPVFSAFFGTAQPGSQVTISGPSGSESVTADDSGRWGRWLVFPGVTSPPAVTVSSPQGSVSPICGS